MKPGWVGARVEREMDYLETQKEAQPCVDVDDKLVEQQVIVAREKNKLKYAKLSGQPPGTHTHTHAHTRAHTHRRTHTHTHTHMWTRCWGVCFSTE